MLNEERFIEQIVAKANGVDSYDVGRAPITVGPENCRIIAVDSLTMGIPTIGRIE